MLNSPLLKRLLVITVYVSATGLYAIIFVPEKLREVVQMLGLGIILFLVVADALYGVKTPIEKRFKAEIYMFLLATFFSMFIANAYQGQNFQITLVAQRYMYFYLFYFALHILQIRVEEIEKMIIPFAFVYVILYLLQYFLYPTLILDTRVALSRGTVRIFLPGAGFMFLAYFLSLQRLMETHKVKYAFLCALFFVIPGILQGTRQSFASFSLVTLAYVFFSQQERSRVFIITVLSLAAIAIGILFQDVFTAMMEVTERQANEQTTNIRVISIRFFTGDFMPHKLAYIFGNGQDSTNSHYGVRISQYRKLGLHQSDIGILGDYSKFGVLFVLAQLSITFRLIFGRLPKQLIYFRYFFISRALVMFTGGNMFGDASTIVFICIMLYMVDCYKDKQKHEHLPEESPPAVYP
jgi:hypothetical protein